MKSKKIEKLDKNDVVGRPDLLPITSVTFGLLTIVSKLNEIIDVLNSNQSKKGEE